MIRAINFNLFGNLAHGNFFVRSGSRIGTRFRTREVKDMCVDFEFALTSTGFSPGFSLSSKASICEILTIVRAVEF